MVAAPMTVALRVIDQAQGGARAFSVQHPEALGTPIEIARIQSVESSNAIESVTASHPRVVALVEDRTTPGNRSEAEIAGYRAVLDTVSASAPQIPFTPSVVEQLHRDLYQSWRARGALEDGRELDRGAAPGRIPVRAVPDAARERDLGRDDRAA